MAAQDGLSFEGTFNSALVGLFKDNSTNDISEADLRALVTAIRESYFNRIDDSRVVTFRGAYDASVNAYPSTGGSGTAGAIQAGNEWFVSVSGDLDINGLGVTTVYYGAIIKALVDAPGTTNTNWRVIQ